MNCAGRLPGTRRLTLAFVWMLACRSSLSQEPSSLVNGAHIQVVGTVGLERRGNNAFIVIKPGQPYTAVFDDTDRRGVLEIGLALDGQSLNTLVGQKVSVAGVIQLEPASPYYLNGTLIIATSIRLANGSVLTPKPYDHVELPARVTQFHSLVKFAPRTSKRWTYKTWDKNGSLLPSSWSYLSCSLNGAGDVMNCYCADGFDFTATGTVSNGHFSKTDGPQEGFDYAQFGIGYSVRRSVSQAVECTRPAHR
jgi:hypothetical protein